MCYCCSERTVKIIIIVLGTLLVVPGIILFILGALFGNEIQVIANSPDGEYLGKIASGITYLFGAMSIYLGIFAIGIGICMGKYEKVANCCACFFNVKSILWFLVFLAMGVVFLAISSLGEKVLEAYCDPYNTKT